MNKILCFRQSSLIELSEPYQFHDLQAVPLDYADKTTDNVDTSKFKTLCPQCPVKAAFGNLTTVNKGQEPFVNRRITALLEDYYNPGSFFFSTSESLWKLASDGTIELFLGDPTGEDKYYAEGNSSVARFSQINVMVQYNETTLLIGDIVNNCVRTYNAKTDWVTQLVGSCLEIREKKIKLEADQEVPANTRLFGGISCLVLLKKSDRLLILDDKYHQIYQYSFTTEMVKLLHHDLQKNLSEPHDMIASEDEQKLYVADAVGLSVVNLETFEVVRLIEDQHEPSYNPDRLFKSGSFQQASIGYINKLKWLVPDQLLVTLGTDANEMMIFIDLKGEQVYSACEGM